VTQPNMPPPSDPTPGFYPDDSQGVMRLWDGQRWTEVTRTWTLGLGQRYYRRAVHHRRSVSDPTACVNRLPRSWQ
jgi:hypothetical protein